MSEEQKGRPVFISATKVKGLVMKDNVVTGDVDFAHLDNVDDLHVSGNVHRTQTQPLSKQQVHAWYQRPTGLLAIGLLIAVAGGGILHLLGWI